MTRSDRHRIEASMLRDELAEERRRGRLKSLHIADLVRTLRRYREREALTQMDEHARRLFDAARTQPISGA